MGIATILCTILYIMHNLDWASLCWRDCQLRSVIMCDTEEVLWNLFETKRAARRWTLSIFATFFCVKGSQTLEQYSTLGLTRDVHCTCICRLFYGFRGNFQVPFHHAKCLVCFLTWYYAGLDPYWEVHYHRHEWTWNWTVCLVLLLSFLNQL